MNQSQLIAAVASATEQKKSEVEKTIKALIAVIESTVLSGEHVFLPNFGRFKLSFHKEKVVRNPTTQGLQKTPASLRPRFNPGARFLAGAVKLPVPSQTETDTVA